jgi:Domain of unknown function (DUF4124)/Protein of unknown function (DUF3617)
MHSVLRIILLSVAALCVGVVDAAIYQCTDKDGKKVFQDTPCSPEQKPLTTEKRPETTLKTPDPSQAEAGAELLEGRWEITSQKLVGDPLQPEGTPQISKECIRNGWLQEQARMHRQMSNAFGGNSCKEISSEITNTIWRASVRCESKEGLMQIEQEIVFSGTSMRGETTATGTVNGKEGREVHRLAGKWLGPC